MLREGRDVQHAEGLHEAVEVTADDVARLNPAVCRHGVAGGVFCPTDGFIRPLAMLQGYVDAAQRLGARFEWGSGVTGLERFGESVVAVETSKGRVAAGAVVNAAGPWAASVAAMAGVRPSGHSAPAPGGGDGAVRPAPGRHADDHLGGRRLSSPRA